MPKLDAVSMDEFIAGARWSPRPLRKSEQAEPYPVECFPPIIRDAVMEVSKYTQAPMAMIGGCALAATSAAIQTCFSVRRDAALAGPASLYVLTIAESGERKSTIDNLFMVPFRRWEAAQAKAAKVAMAEYLNEVREWEKQEDRDEVDRPIAPRTPRMLRGDDTPEALATAISEYPVKLVNSAEAGVIFGSHGMSADSVTRNLAQANAMWDGGPIDQGRVTRERTQVDVMRVTMGLQVQPAPFERFIEKTAGLARGIGYFARFLMSHPASKQGSRYYVAPPPDQPALRAFHDRVSLLLQSPAQFDENDSLTTHYVQLSPDAYHVWVAFHDEVEEALNPDHEYDDIKDVASKAAENAARIACCFHVFAFDPMSDIAPATMRKACHFMRWYLQEATRFAQKHGVTQEVRHAELLEGWLVTHHKKLAQKGAAGTLTVNMARQLGPNVLRAPRTRLIEALELLQDHGRIRVRKGEGTKSEYITIAPQVIEEWSR